MKNNSPHTTIKNIIFDYGDIFINLDKQGAMENALKLFKVTAFTPAMLHTNEQYEMGLITTLEFLTFYELQFPFASQKDIISAWNCILKDFPKHRLQFIKDISQQYRCFLLSNTNQMHIDWIKEDWGMELYNEFKSHFEVFYLSHEMKMRKPNADIFEFVLSKHQLKPEETLFIDDTKENTDTAHQLGMHTWNLNPENEDVVDLLKVKSDLF